MQNHKLSIALSFERQLADEGRRVLSPWRALVYLRRASKAILPEFRRWRVPPNNESEIAPILSRLCHSAALEQLEDFPSLYRTTSPFARTQSVSEEEVLMELHPYSALSHFTAFAFHGLTQQLPKEIHVSIPKEGSSGMPAIGTTTNDWDGLTVVRTRKPHVVFGRPIHWHRLKNERFFGVSEYTRQGLPLRVTTLERTLLDGLLLPGACGGFQNVLESWSAGRDLIQVDLLVELVELFGVSILRQRVGFILEILQIHHSELANWQLHAKRGGSCRLDGSADFSTQVDTRWNLSINARIDSLQRVEF